MADEVSQAGPSDSEFRQLAVVPELAPLGPVYID